ncbi:hypothetical protein [Acinetobacter soli]|jgi:hypothetical protein|uniref:Lipoprotein n=1 Tax=Acinetobacter soli TaxID=487316 RepID=A0AB38YZR3_9GAMM|nr:hypothetical protein [Acinetobacter soli]KQD01656.1 hypothetical protein APD01_04185 [Acinetobacter soli]MBO3639140.1 hypothetical protein [Acinetobacter soli]MBO3671183.1 hypothetical protein [Acinetobacter soli]MBU3120282.1 hypothetical protein [Acinetobacter soli]MBV6550304.1 hypothetical protein [Acinetobacter soli]
MKKLIATAVMTALVTGCATTKSIKYPTAGQQTALSVSSEQMSSMTEAVAGDYFIKDSQIMVGDISNLSSSQASSMFGLVGLGVAIAIDKTKNGSAIEKSTLNKPIKFDQLVSEKINQSYAQNKIDSTLKLLGTDQLAEVKIVPFSRLSFREKPIMLVDFALKSEFKNASDNNASTKRFYYYVHDQRLTLPEWDANNNTNYMTKANRAYDALTKVLVLDVQHQLNLNAFDPEKQKRCKTQPAMSHLFFIQTNDDLCVGVAKTVKGQVVERSLYVVEQ